MKYKIQTFSKNLLKDFLKSNLHLGSPKSEVQNNMNKLLYGFRNNISILNLNHTFVSLQRFFMLVHNLRSTNQHILFLGFPVWLTHQWKKLETKSNGVYKFFNDDLDLAYIGKHSKKIGVIFIFNSQLPNISKIVHFSKEFNIPLSGFASSTSNLYDFPIFVNIKSKKSLLLFYHFLLNTLK